MSIKVLVADDSPTIRRRASATLQEAGYAVTTVEDGAAAWTLLEQGNAADVVLADILMPQLDGYDLCKRIKAHPTLGSLPVMLLRGTFEPWDEQRAMDVGADGFVTKPFEPEALLGALSELLPGGGDSASMAALEDAPDEGSPFGEDLAPASATDAPVESDPLVMEDEPEDDVLAMEDAPIPAAPAAAAAASATAEADDPFGDADDPFGMGGSETPSAPAPVPVAPRPAAAPAHAAVIEPLRGAVQVAATALASGPAGVDEASLERLIEQVLKRMSAEQVEKIVWDVVPDVAEALIRKRMLEIEAKISGG